MSGKRAKRNRRLAIKEERSLMWETSISDNELLGYIYSLFKRYSGYTCISISPPDRYNASSSIVAHKTLPALIDASRYSSTKDVFIEAVKLDKPDFPGLICDRTGKFIYGDVFAKPSENSYEELVVDESAAEII